MTLTFEIADVSFCYTYITPFFLESSAPIYRFQKECERYDVVNEIALFDPSHLPSPNVEGYVLLRQTPAWVWYECLNHYIIKFRPNDQYIGYLEYDKGSHHYRTFVQNDFQNPNPLPISITGFLLQMELTTRRLGFVMHGATIKIGQQCFILTGNSGVGKSTLASLLRKHLAAESVTDDRIILRKCKDGFYAFGNPFDMKNEQCANISSKVDAFFFLYHSKHNQIFRINAPENVHMLLTISLLPYWDMQYTAESVQVLQAITSQIPVFKFGFLPDESAVRFLADKWL